MTCLGSADSRNESVKTLRSTAFNSSKILKDLGYNARLYTPRLEECNLEP